MSYKDKYVQLHNAYGSGIGEAFKNSTVKKINDSFKDSPFYKSITIDGVATDVRIETTDKYNERTLLLRPGAVKSIGSVGIIDGQNWMLVDFFNNEIYPKANIQLCNSNLKWVDDGGFIKSFPCIIELPSRLQLGIAPDNSMVLPEGRRRVTVGTNVDVSKLKRDKRFIFDGRPFKITDMDSLTVLGITYLTVIEDQIKDSDNLDLGISDYFGYVANYIVTILNGEHFSIRAGTSIQLQTEVKNNGKVVSNAVTYSTSDASIATVSPTGLVNATANGNVTIASTLVDDPTIKDTTTITIELDNTNNYSVSIAESPDIIKGASKTLNAVVRNNSQVVNNRSVQFYLYANDGVSPPTAATMTFDSTTQCTIKGNSIGTCKLKVVLVGDSSVYAIIPIQIKSLL